MKAKNGDKVVVRYDGLLDNGEVFESSESSGPLEFVLGQGGVMPAFEAQVLGMRVGERKTFCLPPEEAHGESDPALIQEVERAVLPHAEGLAVGMVLGLTVTREGKQYQVPAMIVALDERTATVDFNHPLAGRSLTYVVTLISLDKAKGQ